MERSLPRASSTPAGTLEPPGAVGTRPVIARETLMSNVQSDHAHFNDVGALSLCRPPAPGRDLVTEYTRPVRRHPDRSAATADRAEALLERQRRDRPAVPGDQVGRLSENHWLTRRGR